MKIGICSDIHVHRQDQVREIQDLVKHVNAHRDLDLLICAGDLSHHLTQVREFLASITLHCPAHGSPEITISGLSRRNQRQTAPMSDTA